MTIKLLLLKSGEDLIADISEMGREHPETKQKIVVGYVLHRPCIVKAQTVNMSPIMEENGKDKAGYSVTLVPWMPLTMDEDILIPSDWVVTIVNPNAQLEKMYKEDVLENGKESDQSDSADEQSDSNQSD